MYLKQVQIHQKAKINIFNNNDKNTQSDKVLHFVFEDKYLSIFNFVLITGSS